jgi:hypothetical protein
MRSFIDKQGKTAWIFDEKTHPLGLKVSIPNEIKPVIEEASKVEVKTPLFSKKKK